MLCRLHVDAMFVIARHYGQLGNRLLLYAHFIAAARHYGVPVWNPSFAEYAEYFPSTRQDLLCRFPKSSSSLATPSLWQRQWLQRAVYLPTRAAAHVRLNRFPFHVIRLKGDQQCDLTSDQVADRVRTGRPILCQGWLFRSLDWFLRYRDDTCRHLQPLDVHQHAVQQTMQKARDASDVVVGVHIRQGDYKDFLGGKYFYTTTLYRRWMDQIAQHLGTASVRFLICSNGEVDWQQFAGLSVQPGPGHLVQDLYSLAQCDLIIGPPSTFTLWAAYYGDVPRIELSRRDQTIDELPLRRAEAA
ncbi:MAG: alpha-1,2-fucosyltransferase [Planctomycetota bacterium]